MVVTSAAAADRAPPTAGARAGRVRLPELARFHEVQILPSTIPHKTRGRRPGGRMVGGPVWPEAARATFVRFESRREWIDQPLEPVERCEARIERPCVWGGYVQPHFGHMVAEHAGRLLWSSHARPDDLVVLVAEPGATMATLPTFVAELLDWYGIDAGRVHLLDRPTLARELRVAPQAEPFHGDPPSEDYLDLLDHHAERAALPPTAAEHLYVGRVGLPGRAKAGHVGEAYLAGVLARLGVRVMDPAALPLREQLAAYAGARHLIFAEGSAVHGRQLLGRADQAITVIARRHRRRIAAPNLGPRCASLAYVEAVRATVAPVLWYGARLPSLALAFYDVPALHRGLAARGLDVASVWDDEAYQAACRADLEGWVEALAARPDLFDAAASRQALEALDAGDGLPPVPAT